MSEQHDTTHVMYTKSGVSSSINHVGSGLPPHNNHLRWQGLNNIIKLCVTFQVICLLTLLIVPEALAKPNDQHVQKRNGPIPLTVVVRGGGTVTSSPEGISCSEGKCRGIFPRGTVVRLNATPEDGMMLSKWRGACRGSRGCKVKLKRPKTVLASFKTPRLVPLSVYVRGAGTVTSTPEGISCSERKCRGEFPRGTVVRLHAKPAEGHILHRWRGACGGSKGCKVKLKKHRKVMATFRTPPLLRLQLKIKGEGIVTSSPEGLECSQGKCLGKFPENSIVTLTAIPGKGQSFKKWRGPCRGKETCTVKMKKHRKIFAQFTTALPPPPVILTIALKGKGKITSSPEGLECSSDGCKGEFPHGTVVTLKPMAGEGHVFSEWGGACKGNETCTITLTEPVEIQAGFVLLPNTTLTVLIVGEGIVLSDPDGIECKTGTCVAEFKQGTAVTLTAKPGEGQIFTKWFDDCQTEELTCKLILTRSMTVGAQFETAPPPPDVQVSVTIVGEGSVMSTPAGLICTTGICTSPFPSGTTVTLNATPDAGQSFSGWTGACSGLGSCMVTVTTATAATATFIPSTPGGNTNAEAIRFLEQATWGPTATSIAHVQSIGKAAFLAEQFAATPSTYPDPVDNSSSLGPLQDQWFYNVFHGQDQLRQRVAFALSQLFVVSAKTVGRDDQMIPYQRMLLNNGLGNFFDLMRAVTLSPTMGRYLDMVNNDKTDPGSGLNPNVNYGRELLQLFTVGTKLLNLDGSEVLDGNGQSIQPYDQNIIVNFSRVYTGWTYPTIPGETPRWRNEPYFAGPMEAIDEHHDTNQKVLMNGFIIPAGGTAQEDLDAALTHIFNHPNVGPFVATRLIRHLVTSNPSPQYIQRVATVFNGDQGGVRGNMQAVITAVLLDPEAETVMTNGGHLREPILYGVALLRALNANVQLDNPLYVRTRDMGQDLFSAPHVFNFFSPLHKIPRTNVFGPEYEIHTLSSVMARANFVDRVVKNGLGGGTTIDLSTFEAVAADAGQLVAAVEQALLHENLTDAERQSIITAVSVTNNATNRARSAIYLVATSAKYQVQH